MTRDRVARGRVGIVIILTVSTAWAAIAVDRPVMAAQTQATRKTASVGISPRPLLPPPIRGQRQARAGRPDPVSRRALRAPGTAPLPSGTWQPLGPAAIGPPYLQSGGFYGGTNSGRITGIVVIPSGAHAGRVVIGSAGGGIWTTDNSGATWSPRSDFQPDLAIGSVAVDPSNPSHIIAGTGEGNQSADSYPGDGVLVSSDAGTTWSLQNPAGVFTGIDIEQVAIDPSNSNHQFAATTGGLFVTSDGGITWAKPTAPSYTSADGNITSVVIDPASSSTVYIGGGAERIAKSSDGGITWAPANTGIAPPGSAPLISLAIAASSSSTLYASVGSTGAVRLYKSTNSGASWSLTSAPDYTGQAYAYGSGSGEQGWYDNVVAVDPTNASHVVAGGIALIESTTGGSPWTNVNGGSFFGAGTNVIHPDQHALAFASDGTLWIGDDGGVYHYNPLAGSVANANGNLNITQFYFGFNVVGGTLLAGSQDNGSAETSTSSLSAWTGIFSGDGGPSAITSNDSNIRFIQADENLYVTTDAFTSTLSNITPRFTLGLFTPPTLVVPNTSTPSQPTVFYGGAGLYRTTNPTSSPPTWSQVANAGQNVSAITVSPSNSQVIYVGFTNGTIEVSTDGGATFSALAAPPSTGDTFVTGLTVNPSNDKEVTASFSFNDTRYAPGLPHVAQYVYTSTPGTGTWTTITGSGLPAAVSRVIYDNGALVAATDAGVYATGAPSGSSTSWTSVGSGLPNVQVQDAFVDSSGALYVVTHGRGAWELPGGPSSVVVTAGSPTVTYGQGDLAETWYTPNSPLCQVTQSDTPPPDGCIGRPINPIVTCSYSGLASGTTAPELIATGRTDAEPGAAAGSYPTFCWGAADPSYTFSYVGGTLTINPAPLNVRPTSATVQHGGRLPMLSWKANFVNQDTASSLRHRPTCVAAVKISAAGKVMSPAGTYAIRCWGAKDRNYSIHYRIGLLRVTPPSG